MIECRIIDRAHRSDIRLKNDPFELVGRLVPELKDGQWSYKEELFPEVTEMRFPDEAYEFEDGLFIGAYDGNICVGLAILKDDMFRYMLLDDLKVDRAYRGRGVGRRLVDKALETAAERGYLGLCAVCQDNNLRAARFYLKAGFAIGGFDNRGYRGTSQENKADIRFYLDI